MGRFLFLVSFLLAAPALADPAIPDTAPGKTLTAFLAAFNSGKLEQIKDFIERYHWAIPADRVLGLYQETGGFTLLKIEKSDDTALSVLVGEKGADRILRETVSLSADPEPKLRINLEGIPRPPEFALPRLTQADALVALAARADAAAAEDKFSGAMLIEHDGKTVFQKSWGLADRAAKIPITAETKFRLGSMNKMFTAVAALQLVAAGKLSLDGTVGTYLPDYPNKEIATKVTIRQLLNHTGGTGDIFGPQFDTNRLSLKTNADYVKLYGARAPLFEPGTKERYSNYGFVLLGYIVEKVSGEDYYAYVRKHIFDPAGMKDTGSLPEDIQVPDRSTGYMRKDGQLVPNTDTLPYRGMAAGGGYSTLGDLLKFAHGLENDILLPKPLLEQATNFQTKGKWYGFGFMVDGEGLTRYYGHNGGAPGMNAELRIYPQLHTVIVGLGNMDGLPDAPTLVDFYALRMPLTP